MFSPINYYQAKNVLLLKEERQAYDGLNFQFSLIGNNPPDCGVLVGIDKLSDICVKVNLFSSKSEFFRKLKEGAVKFHGNWGTAKNKITADVQLDLEKENCCEVRYGRKFLEIIVAGC